MSKSQDALTREQLGEEIIKKARGDQGFRQLVIDHPQEACGHFGFRIPGAAGESVSYGAAVELMYRRREFYSWYYQHVLSAVRDAAAAAGPQNLGSWENMEWDFEVTKYAPAVKAEGE